MKEFCHLYQKEKNNDQIVEVFFTPEDEEGKLRLEGTKLFVPFKEQTDPQAIFYVHQAIGKKIREEKIEALQLPLLRDQKKVQLLGLFNGNYSFDRFKSKKQVNLKHLYVAWSGEEEKKEIADWLDLCALNQKMRDLDTLPYNELSVARFADYAKELMEDLEHIDFQILDHEMMEKEKFNLHLAVGKGSFESDPPKVIVINYHPIEGAPAIAMVGKGVVYDTGGYSIKTTEGMREMNGDMAGASLLLHLLCFLAIKKIQKNITIILPLADNSIDHRAFRISDIYVGRSKKSVEITNTDAEGRLLLADSLHYIIEKYQPKRALTVATLTGASIVALGEFYAGLFTNDELLKGQLLESSKRTGELLWPLPLSKDFFSLLKSSVADMKNSGNRKGGASQGAAFIEAHMTTKIPFAHIDIAPVSMRDSLATGYGLNLLVDFIYSI